MLPKKYRLSLDQNLIGKKLSTPFATFIFKNNQLSHLRVALIVSKKVALKASARNHLKRQFLSALRSQLSLDLGFDLLIILKPAANSLDFIQIQHLFQKLHSQIREFPS